MGEKETNAGLGQAAPEGAEPPGIVTTGAGGGMRAGGPIPEVDPSDDPSPDPAAVLKNKTKSNQSND